MTGDGEVVEEHIVETGGLGKSLRTPVGHPPAALGESQFLIRESSVAMLPTSCPAGLSECAGTSNLGKVGASGLVEYP